jgi:hypothetical protein
MVDNSHGFDTWLSDDSFDCLKAYPGVYVPRPLEFELAHTDATVSQLATEILALSKLNWNNTQFDGGEPITVRAARRVGDILKCIPTDGIVRPRPSTVMARGGREH